jgi:hypothetical protein
VLVGLLAVSFMLICHPGEQENQPYGASRAASFARINALKVRFDALCRVRDERVAQIKEHKVQ